MLEIDKGKLTRRLEVIGVAGLGTGVSAGVPAFLNFLEANPNQLDNIFMIGGFTGAVVGIISLCISYRLNARLDQELNQDAPAPIVDNVIQLSDYQNTRN